MIKRLENFHIQMPTAVGVIRKTLEVPNQLHLIHTQINAMQQRVENIQKNVDELSKFNIELNKMLIDLENEEESKVQQFTADNQNDQQFSSGNFNFL